MQIASTFTMQRARHELMFAVQERNATCRIIASAEFDTLLHKSHQKLVVFPTRWLHGNGCYNANYVLMRPLYLQMCCIHETLPSCLSKNNINGGANHITNYLHLTFEG